MGHKPIGHREAVGRRPTKSRVYDVALSLWVVVTVATLSTGRHQDAAAEYVAAMSIATPRTGVLADVGLHVVDVRGRIAMDDGPANLLDLARGRCTYVVIGSADCPYSMALAQRWQTIAGNEGGQASFPGVWQGLWVWVSATGEPVSFLGPEFPVPRFQAESPLAFVEALGVNAFPYHFVLGPDGRVVTHGVGGALLPLAAFLDDCRLQPQLPGQIVPENDEPNQAERGSEDP